MTKPADHLKGQDFSFKSWSKLTKAERRRWLARPDPTTDLSERVAEILQAVREGGDHQVQRFTAQFDGVSQQCSLVELPTREVASERLRQKDPELVSALEVAEKNITAFHQTQLRENTQVELMGGELVCERVFRPMDSVGLYVPGGQAPLISSLLMMAIPARIAQVRYKVLCSPPVAGGGVHPLISDLAAIYDIHEVHAIGGAQAIGAMAYGTQSVRGVDKIFGPGNLWVTEAKKQISLTSTTAVDLPAGPSEVMVVADLSASSSWVAADLLAQAEHGSDAQVICALVAKEESQQEIAAWQRSLAEEIRRLVLSMSTGPVICQALNNARFFHLTSRDQALELINQYAPEHLILQLASSRDLVPDIHHAGSVFLGHLTPESLGDYVSGTNHILPTAGYARSSGGLSVEAFQKAFTVQEYRGSHPLSQNGRKLFKAGETLAEREGLEAHGYALKVRSTKISAGVQELR